MIIEEYISYEEIYYAYKECSKNKKRTENAANYIIHENENLNKLYFLLNSKKYEIGKSITFLEEFPKWREIFAADFIDRIVQHIIVNKLSSHLDKNEFIPNSFSCRKNKGTLYGVKTLEEECRKLSNDYTKTIYILQCDCKSYFYSLDKNILFDKVLILINKYSIFNDNEKDFFIDLIKQVIFHCPQKDCNIQGNFNDWEEKIDYHKTLFNCDDFHGLPIGNISSQFFSNIYMNDFDHYVYDTLGFKFYGRYCDDFYILDESKEKLLKTIPKIEEYLKDINITLNPNKIKIQENTKGVKFIGSVIKKERTYISNRTVGRCYDLLIKTYNYSKHNELTKNDIEYFVNAVNSYFGFFKHHKTYNIRKKILKSKYIKNLSEYIIISPRYNKISINKAKFNN